MATMWMVTIWTSAAPRWTPWAPSNGTVVVVDPQTGRILTIVNQKTALESGFIPCSTIKLVTAFAALNEALVERERRYG